jgi:hypothetical protein
MQPDQQNKIFSLAADLVNKTNQNIFLTGKAGTGKTTFLKYIKEHTIKNTVVVAPTGVAAINAGGVTMHSFFQLPFGPYIPQSYSGNKFSGSYKEVSDKNTLFKNIRFDKNKRKLLNELQLLIIDEISMVRADILDAVDAILRHFRRNYMMPFGGVQVLFIGDMYQLPPVIKDDEWQLLSEYYNSHFFFDAKVTSEAPPLYIELKKIYRQSEQKFIDILNRVRNNNPKEVDLDILNDLYNPTIDHSANKAVLLTTHNYKADKINEEELYKLNAVAHIFKGTIEGDFNDKLLPNDLELELKEGAQIMFIKNDSSAEKKYFNGRLATIKKIEAEKIAVLFENDPLPYVIKKETWKNLRYKLNSSNQIEEEELGSYTQYPIRLAWAITIHKSQGLTFEKLIIDAGQSFAAGQVYVALSRCTSLEGLILHSRIERTSIKTDERIVAFSRQEAKADELQRVLDIEKETYMSNQLIDQFKFSKLILLAEEFFNLVKEKNIPNKNTVVTLATTIIEKAKTLENIAGKFIVELRTLFANKIIEKELITTRVKKALSYFTTELLNGLLIPLQKHKNELASASKVKQYLTALKSVEIDMYSFIAKLNNVVYDDIVFNEHKKAIENYNPEIQKPIKPIKENLLPSAQVTFEMFEEGKNIEQIAVIRNLAQSTVEGHLAQYVRKGELDIYKMLNKEKVEIILKAIEKIGGHTIAPIKAILEDDISFGDIRAVINYKDWLEETTIKK